MNDRTYAAIHICAAMAGGQGDRWPSPGEDAKICECAVRLADCLMQHLKP